MDGVLFKSCFQKKKKKTGNIVVKGRKVRGLS